MGKRISIKEVKKRTKKAHGNIVKLKESTYKGVSAKCIFIDKKYGEWEVTPDHVMHGHGHPTRGTENAKKLQIISIKTVKEKIKKVHGDVVKIKESTYKKAKDKCIFIDKDYGEWPARPTNVMRGQGHPKRGRENAKKSLALPIDIVKERIKKVHGDVVKIKESTYESTNKKCIFIDKKYGKWPALPHHVMRGHGHPTRGALKQAKSSNNSYILQHWETGEEIVCVASYEKKAVEYFNINKINYLWQHKSFTMPDGKTFRPDCYLVAEDKWIEIKGYFREDAQEKWEWFHKEYPNSELWNEKKLKEMGIL